MNKILLFLSIFCFLSSAVYAEEKPLTLAEAYRLSLKRSEDIAMKVETLNAAQGRFYRASDTVMPKADFVMTHKEQDASGSSGSTSTTDSSLTRRVIPEKKFTFSQPIFSGFKEFAALQGSGAEKEQRVFEIERAKELLFMDVVDAFYGVFLAQEDVEILKSIHTALENRIKELT